MAIIIGNPPRATSSGASSPPETLIGTNSNDTFDHKGGSDKIDGRAGTDTVLFFDSSSHYAITTLAGITHVNALGGAVSPYTNSEAVLTNIELIQFADGSVNLSTTSNNTLVGMRPTATSSGASSPPETLIGTNSNDTFDHRGGSDQIDGGPGTDTIVFFDSSSHYAITTLAGITHINALGGAVSPYTNSEVVLTNVERFQFSDNLIVLDIRSNLSGGAGNDILDGGAGIGTMTGGDGSDTYYVRDIGNIVSETNAVASTGGTDRVHSYLAAYTLTTNVENGRILATGAANLTGNTLNNVLYAGVGNNVLDGSTGTDTVSYAYGVSGTTGVTVSLALTTAQATDGSGSDRLVGIEKLTGSAYADRLTGNSAANVLNGGAGNDTLDGGAGIDTMTGGNGSDTYYVRNVGDLVRETNATASTGGTDKVYSYLSTYTLGTNVENGRILATGAANLAGNSLANVLYAGTGNNVLNGSTGTDTASYAYATAGVQVSLALTSAQATGGSGSDRLVGIEKLTGSAYADRLTGNSNANTLDGGAGNDFLTGGAGKDLLIGGTGSDTFDFNVLSEMGTTSATWDVISDFVRGQDKIDLSTLDANTVTTANDVFDSLTVGSVFSGRFASAGDLYFDKVAKLLYGSTDADAAAEFVIQLTGVSTLSTSDFIL
jgi:Ca2+-binding RTX toxin-like protein